MNNYDLIIVGAGPAGIFTALELLRKSSKTTGPRICLIEKGKPVDRKSTRLNSSHITRSRMPSSA